MRNGQGFNGIEIGYFDDRIRVFDWIQNKIRSGVDSRAGDFPAMSMVAKDDGLIVLAYESTPSTLQYNDWEKFVAFAKHKDFRDAVALHNDRNLPTERFNELYTRYCKSLIGVGNSAGQDANTNLETEFIALNNPYTDDLSDGFSVKLLYQGNLRKHAQVEVFERGPDNKVEVSYLRSDAQGLATIPVKPGHTYLLDAVVLRKPEADLAQQKNVAWETLWASMTFAVPK